MKYTVIPADELSPDLTARWAAIQEANPSLCSPYFRPEFTEAVAAVRDDAFVCILEDRPGVVGFFPFHRRRGGVGQPIGLGLSDYHGIVADPNLSWNVQSMLRSCNLVRFEFDHLPDSQRQLMAYCTETAESSIAQLDTDFAAYEERRREIGAKQLKETYRRIRKLERELEAPRFVLDELSTDVFQQMIAWKRQQCIRTGVVDYFSKPWTVELVRRIHRSKSANFGGNLAALYVGKKLAAVHFIMHSGRVWHSWFPGYSADFHQYSPGLILVIELIRAGCATPVDYLDFGKDLSTWKAGFRTGALEVGVGRAEIPAMRNHIHAWINQVEPWARRSCLRPLLRFPGKILKYRARRQRYE